MKKVKILPNTLAQLESLKNNSRSFIHPPKYDEDNQIWLDDITALDNAIAIIKAYKELTVIIDYKLILDFVDKLKILVEKVPDVEGIECELEYFSDNLLETVTELDRYIIGLEIDAKLNKD